MQGEWKSRDVIWKIYSEISEKSAPPSRSIDRATQIPDVERSRAESLGRLRDCERRTQLHSGEREFIARGGAPSWGRRHRPPDPPSLSLVLPASPLDEAPLAGCLNSQVTG